MTKPSVNYATRSSDSGTGGSGGIWSEQPVIDLELRLAGKLVDTKVMEALEYKGFMPPEHRMVIDAMLTMP
ncbi:hypothetical protein Egran_00820, partial [Elaphomyces granulatus]